MSNPKQRLPHFAPSRTAYADPHWMGLQIDHRQFLDALQDELLCPSAERCGRMLGLSSFIKEHKGTDSKPGNWIAVSLFFDLCLLPVVTVSVRVAGMWQKAKIDSLPADVEVVFWPGAIPLFAVSRISVKSAEERARRIGLAQHVSNVSMPDVAVEVRQAIVHSYRHP